MKLIVSSDHLCTVNAEKVKLFWVKRVEIAGAETFIVTADDIELSKYNSSENAKKILDSITTSLTSSLSDIVLRMENVE